MLRHLVPAFGLVAPALAQTTWTVQGGGAALQQAINAAAPHDILDVYPGSYTPATATRGLRISLRAGAQIVTSSPYVTPAITVTALPAGEAFVLEGGNVQGFHAIGCAGVVVLDRFDDSIAGSAISLIDACTGTVACQGLTCVSAPLTNGTLEIRNSTSVSFTNCRLQRTVVTNSTVAFANVVVPIPYGFYAGLHIVSGSVSIAGGSISGSTTASLPGFAPGVLIDQGRLSATGGATFAPSPIGPARSIPAIQANGGTLRLDPSVQLLSTPPISGPGLVTFAPVPSLAVWRVLGSTSYSVNVLSEPNSVVFTLLGLPVPGVPSPFGDLWLDPVSPLLDFVVMPASGTHSFQHSLAGVPPFFVLVVQAAALSPTSNAITASPPVRFVWD